MVAVPGFDTRDQFGAVSKVVHWLTLLLVASLFGIGWYMVDLPLEPESFEVYALHKSLGVTVLGLTILRIVWRTVNPMPRLLGSPPTWQRIAARTSHGFIYLLLIALPMSGWLLSSAADFLPSWFGLFELPALAEPDDALRETTRTIHQILGRLLMVLLMLHVAAALKHHFVDKDATLRRMLWGSVR